MLKVETELTIPRKRTYFALKNDMKCRVCSFTGCREHLELTNLELHKRGVDLEVRSYDMKQLFVHAGAVVVNKTDGTQVKFKNWSELYNSDLPFTSHHQASKDVFNPFKKPTKLTSMPKKWTLAHVKKALMNNQFSDLRCRGRYTDDYQYDAATNFGQDRHVDPVEFTKTMTESRGFYVYGSVDASGRTIVAVGQGHWNNYQFVAKL